MCRFLVRLALSALAALVTSYSISIAYFIDRSIATYGPNPRNWGAIYTPYTRSFHVGFLLYILAGAIVGSIVYRRLGRTRAD